MGAHLLFPHKYIHVHNYKGSLYCYLFFYSNMFVIIVFERVFCVSNFNSIRSLLLILFRQSIDIWMFAFFVYFFLSHIMINFHKIYYCTHTHTHGRYASLIKHYLLTVRPQSVASNVYFPILNLCRECTDYVYFN